MFIFKLLAKHSVHLYALRIWQYDQSWEEYRSCMILSGQLSLRLQCDIDYCTTGNRQCPLHNRTLNKIRWENKHEGDIKYLEHVIFLQEDETTRTCMHWVACQCNAQFLAPNGACRDLTHILHGISSSVFSDGGPHGPCFPVICWATEWALIGLHAYLVSVISRMISFRKREWRESVVCRV